MKTLRTERKTRMLGIALIVASGCVTERDRTGAGGQNIPGRSLAEVNGSVEYLCEPLFVKSIKETEELLDQYGKSGWHLSGFMVKEGNTYAYCLSR